MADLERIHDGPIPEALRQAARLGGPAQVRLARVEARLQVYRWLIRNTINGLRAPRPDARAGYEASLREQLAWYREQRHVALRKSIIAKRMVVYEAEMEHAVLGPLTEPTE